MDPIVENTEVIILGKRFLPQFQTNEHAEKLFILLEEWGLSSCYEFFLRMFDVPIFLFYFIS